MDLTTPTLETTFYQYQKSTSVKTETQSPNGFLKSKGTIVKSVWVENSLAIIPFFSVVIAKVPIHNYQVIIGDVYNLRDHWGFEHNIWQ